MRFGCVRLEACDLHNQTDGYRDKGQIGISTTE